MSPHVLPELHSQFPALRSTLSNLTSLLSGCAVCVAVWFSLILIGWSEQKQVWLYERRCTCWIFYLYLMKCHYKNRKGIFVGSDLSSVFCVLFTVIATGKQDSFPPWSLFAQTFFSRGISVSGRAYLLIKSLRGVSAAIELKTRNYINCPQNNFEPLTFKRLPRLIGHF